MIKKEKDKNSITEWSKLNKIKTSVLMINLFNWSYDDA